jgi:hypothetical protein
MKELESIKIKRKPTKFLAFVCFLKKYRAPETQKKLNIAKFRTSFPEK